MITSLMLCAVFSVVPVNETGKWQAKIDAASAAGGGRVVIPEGTHPVAELALKSKKIDAYLINNAIIINYMIPKNLIRNQLLTAYLIYAKTCLT